MSRRDKQGKAAPRPPQAACYHPGAGDSRPRRPEQHTAWTGDRTVADTGRSAADTPWVRVRTAIATDLDTTVAGVQTAITLFTLTIAALMIPGSKLTDLWSYGFGASRQDLTIGDAVTAREAAPPG